VYQHHGNGEHPQSLERRRQLLLWRSLAALIVFGVAVGLLRLLIGLLGDTPSRSLFYQAGLLTVNGLLGLLVAARLRWLRRR
jgi:Na+/melibiose symporter-like transporter